MTDLTGEYHRVLLDAGWYAVNAAVFRRGRFELVFDTSSYVEVYVAETRVAESALRSPDDFKRFLEVTTQGFS